MQSARKVADKKTKREIPKEEVTPKKLDDKLKKNVHNACTPRNFIQKSTISDIYSKNAPTKAPKKTSSTNKINTSPMKDFLKSSPSSVSTRSSGVKNGTRTPNSARPAVKDTKSVVKKIPFNVTVNSPVAKRKDIESKRIDLDKTSKVNKSLSKEVRELSLAKRKNVETDKKDSIEKLKIDNLKGIPGRQRTKTRTLDDEEIKVLTPDVVENNAELLNLNKKLRAQPKAFYIDFDDTTKVKITKEKSSDEEVSYEDDFESYESDFDSYHSETKSGETKSDGTSDVEADDDDEENILNDEPDRTDGVQENDDEGNSKEERMLDSGNFDLRDPRLSASKSKPMDYITEVSEDGEKVVDDERKKSSLVDEGFQEMSSGLSSMKTLHIDVLERPLFIDFTKSKENRRKRRIFERLKQRAQDILSMVTLHEMSYNLFEMAPIPYDLYMATFGRFNYKQTAAQTYDDGVTEEVQTEEIECNNKWTQNPVEFSKNDIYLNTNKDKKEKNKDLQQFPFFTDKNTNKTEISDIYKNNPLRIYLEQKDGVGSDDILPKEVYDLKLKNNKYDVNRLKKFLKKAESRVSFILSANSGNTGTSNLIKNSKFSFSNGYVSISTRNLDEKTNYLRDSKIIGAVFSETKNNLIITIHEKCKTGVAIHKCVLCLWDCSMVKREPIKILIATDNVKIGRFRGNTDGYFVGALEDGSIHLWDLSEEPTWCNDVAINPKPSKMVEYDPNETKHLTQTEKDREWNKKNSAANNENQAMYTLQASAYTSSAMSVCNNEIVDNIVGLEFLGDNTSANLENGRKIIRQICSLQSTGILTIWSLIQEKTKTTDIGKAFWSKMKLERNQTINLTQHFDISINNTDMNTNFNLNLAKKRLINKRQEKKILKKLSRQNSSKSDSDRPSSAASVKNRSLIENSFFLEVVCCHLKIVKFKNTDHFLVAKNYGEVLCSRKVLGNMKIKRLSVANTASSVTCLEVSPNKLPFFLAATDCGTVNLCSLLDCRVLLTLDCRNLPISTIDKYQVDEKGRYLGTVPDDSQNDHTNVDEMIKITSLAYTHPLRILATCGNTALLWELSHSDARVHGTCAARACCTSGLSMALLTSEELQIHRLSPEEHQLQLFNKYVALL